MRTHRPTLLLCLALGMLLLAACQAEATAPASAGVATATTTRPPLTTATGQPAVDQPEGTTGPAAHPTAASQTDADRETPDSDVDEGEPGSAETMPVQETGTANADVEFVAATQEADGSWRFDVTVRHPDTSWQDYADGWDVLTPDGRVLKANEDDPFTRLLLHPHENEQPFTRSQSGIVVPEDVTVVLVRAHDLVDGFGGREVEVDLTLDQGPGFQVSRQ